MTRDKYFKDTRNAGEVIRYHTWLTHQRQTVAAHSWHLQRIFIELFPDRFTADIAKYITFHDCGELVAGDMPFPIKLMYPELRPIVDLAEGNALKSMGIDLPELSKNEKLRFKIAEYIEMMEFGTTEIMLGNHFAYPIVDDMLREIRKLSLSLIADEQKRVWEYVGKRAANFKEGDDGCE